jgi:outer membrane protein assembly factor BamB
MRLLTALIVLFVGAGVVRGQSVQTTQTDWLTWGYDQERTGWNKSETTLTKENVGRLQLKWKSQLATKPNQVILSTLTAPLVATINGGQRPETLVYVVGSDNVVYALDSETGEVAWQKTFPNTLTPKEAANYQCSDSQNATPVIDKDAGIIYVSTSDGKLRGLSLANGEERMSPVSFTDPYARNWSLNLIDGVIYSATARGCGGGMAHFTATDVQDPAHRTVEYYTSNGRPNGSWGRGGLVRGPKGVYAQTADGPYDPAAGNFGESLMALSLKDLRLQGSYTPVNWEYLNDKDLDLGSTSPVVFPFQKLTLMASVGKEAIIYLLDANNLGGQDHHTPLYQSPRYGNDEALLHDRGIWGAMSTWQDDQQQRWLVMSLMGPPGKDTPPYKYSYGDVKLGAMLAMQVVADPAKGTPMIKPVWISREMHAPDPPVVANGVVYALQTGRDATESRTAPKPGIAIGTNAVLYALDAQTGKQLYSSENSIESWAHFSEPVVVGDNVYVCTWDGKVYAFGLKK